MVDSTIFSVTPGPVLFQWTVGHAHFASWFCSIIKRTWNPSTPFFLSHSSSAIPELRSFSFLQFFYIYSRSKEHLFKSTSDVERSKTPAQRSPNPDQLVQLFANVRGDTVIASTATLSQPGTTNSSYLRRKVHNQDLPCGDGPDHVAICSPAFHEQFKTLPYLYHLITAYDVPGTLGDLLTTGV